MKFKSTFFNRIIFLFVIIFLPGYADTTEAGPSPAVQIKQSTYEFSTVIAGTEVEHCFSVLNKGDAQLNIINVYSG